VYTGFSDGNVAAFDAVTGAERWAPVDLAAEVEAATGEAPQYLDVDTTPVPATIRPARSCSSGSYAAAFSRSTPRRAARSGRTRA
jgi:hypothetical protein